MNVIFNKVFYDLIKELKKLSPLLRNAIRKNYKVKTVGSENVDFFMRNMYDRFDVESSISPLDDSNIQDVLILKDVSLQLIKENVSKIDASVLDNYIYTLSIIARATDDATFRVIVNILGHIQNGESYDIEKDKIIDEDIVTLFSKLSTLQQSNSICNSLPPFLENTMIGGLAKELTEEIDIASLGITKPEDLLTHSGGLGAVIGKITDKLQTKISSGTLDPALLMKEAFSLVNTDKTGMFSNPVFADIMKNMMNPCKEACKEADIIQTTSPVQNRLRKKLAEKLVS